MKYNIIKNISPGTSSSGSRDSSQEHLGLEKISLDREKKNLNKDRDGKK